MFRRLMLPLIIFLSMGEAALGHQIGLAEQLLAPVTQPKSLLSLLAVGLLWRQQSEMSFTPVNNLVTAIGLAEAKCCSVRPLASPYSR
ncbi:MAG: hypothetical protein JSR78_07840 [Proteobacteria bacterium]|nr:hypothetical protein [Pseudomonadota bacterium]